jgi:hypothetical protein
MGMHIGCLNANNTCINEELLNEAKMLSGAKTKKETVEIALEEFIKRRTARNLLELEGKDSNTCLIKKERNDAHIQNNPPF